MKSPFLIPLLFLPLVGCETFNQPLESDGANPLDPPGRSTPTAEASDPYGPLFTPGTFLQTVSPQTAFFAKFPKAEDQPIKTLGDYTDVKVISSKGSYVKIEVVDTGDVGYVPSVMLGEKRSPDEVPVTFAEGELPVGQDVSADLLLPQPSDILPPSSDLSDLPAIAPDPEIPGIEAPEELGAEAPAVVDPSLPAE